MADILVLRVQNGVATIRLNEFNIEEDFPLPYWCDDTKLAGKFIQEAANARINELRRGIPYEESFLQHLKV